MELRRGDLIAEWEYIGEGWSGDYNPDDPEDQMLLRFSVLKFYPPAERTCFGQWIQVDDASYCTRMPVDTDEKILMRALEIILDAAENESPKRRFEELSWLAPEDFE